jgi:hypothetical protein
MVFQYLPHVPNSQPASSVRASYVRRDCILLKHSGFQALEGRTSKIRECLAEPNAAAATGYRLRDGLAFGALWKRKKAVDWAVPSTI